VTEIESHAVPGNEWSSGWLVWANTQNDKRKIDIERRNIPAMKENTLRRRRIGKPVKGKGTEKGAAVGEEILAWAQQTTCSPCQELTTSEGPQLNDKKGKEACQGTSAIKRSTR